MLLSELEELVDIFDDILPVEDLFTFSIEEETDIIEACIQLMSDYIDENPTSISEPDFEDCLLESVKQLLLTNMDTFFKTGLKREEEEDLDEIIENALELFYNQINPRRSFPYTFKTRMCENKIEKDRIFNRLQYLASIPQSSQRTKEWYETRHKLITASNAYKAFESESTQNQLIYEKCQPLKVFEQEENTTTQDTENVTKVEFVNINTSMHWGQKYEPVSVMYYETTYNTKVSEYGCIQHDSYHFLGASPDGIVSDPSANNFGRMLEIKNIVNREIDGIPKKEYWIQMQLQMETCDLNECDFLETRFKEYVDETEFMMDSCGVGPSSFLKTMDGLWKGIILYFSSKEGKPLYIYKPLSMCKEYYEEVWEPQQIQEYEQKGFVWIKNLYWKLEEVSCVLVPRNKRWFQDNIVVLSNLWDTIVKERVTGFQHRAPSRRNKKQVGDQTEMEDMCLLNIDKMTGKVILNNTKSIHPFLKIRTESIL